MPTDTHRLAAMADPDQNQHFRRRWSQPSLTSRQVERASEFAAAADNRPLAGRLSSAALHVRCQAEVRS